MCCVMLFAEWLLVLNRTVALKLSAAHPKAFVTFGFRLRLYKDLLFCCLFK